MTTPDNSATDIKKRLQRYDTIYEYDTLQMMPHDDGEYYRVKDADALIATLEADNARLRGLFRELLDIAECDANTEENADVILRAQAAARAAEGGEDA